MRRVRGGIELRQSRKRYVVTGCAGFIGSHLVDTLLAAGHEVVGIDAFTDYYARQLKESNVAAARRHSTFTLVDVDLAERSVEALLEGVSGVFHLAAQPGVRGSWGDSFAIYARDNIIASERVFEAAATAGVRVVFASSSSIYGNAEKFPTPEDAHPLPISPYGVTKLACEELAYACRSALGLDVVVLRFFTVYGPRQRPDMAFARILRALAAGSRFDVYGGGEQSRDFTYVADAVSASVLAMDAAPSGATYNVGGGSEASLREVVEICERVSGRRLNVRFGREAPGDVERTAADTRRIRSELGWSPAARLEEGVAAQLDSIVSSGRAGTAVASTQPNCGGER